MKNIELISYSLIAGWFALVIIYNIFRYALDKQRQELYLYHLKYKHVKIIEHRIKPIYLEDSFMYDSMYMKKEHIEKEINYSVQKIAQQHLLKYCQIKERECNQYGTKIVEVKLCVIPLNQ